MVGTDDENFAPKLLKLAATTSNIQSIRAARVHLQTLDQITPVLLTYNEEQSTSRMLSHHLAKDIVVIGRGRPCTLSERARL